MTYYWYGQISPGEILPVDNVAITIGICSRCSQEPTFKVEILLPRYPRKVPGGGSKDFLCSA